MTPEGLEVVKKISEAGVVGSGQQTAPAEEVRIESASVS